MLYRYWIACVNTFICSNVVSATSIKMNCYFDDAWLLTIRIMILKMNRAKERPHLYANANKACGTEANANKCQKVACSAFATPSKRSAGYSLAARMGLVFQKIVGSGEVYVHISMIANVFFFEVPTPDE